MRKERGTGDVRSGRTGRILSGFLILAVLLFLAVFSGGRKSSLSASGLQDQSGLSEETELFDTGLSIRKIKVPIEGLTEETHLLLVNDLHIIPEEDPDVDDDKKAEVRQRRTDYFHTADGRYSEELWKDLPAQLDSMGADAILFDGDLIDYCSPETTALLKEGFDSLKTPWIYARGDHDYGAWFSYQHESQDQAIALQEETWPREKVMVKYAGDLTIIGWDNSTSQMTEKGLSKLEDALDQARSGSHPVLFLCHVPLQGSSTGPLEQECLEKRGSVRMWGERDCDNQPDRVTKKALDLVLADDSPVKLVCSGHLHFPYAGKLNDHCSIVVGDPAYEGRITELDLVPKG